MLNDMMDEKITRAVKLLQSIRYRDGEPIEIAYSGGKDSDVILELARMAGIEYRAIYKCTTIDPPGTIRHCKDNGVEIRRPKETFFELVRKKGLPTRWSRFCCSVLKEYPILYNVVIGVRRSESKARADRYREPVMCRVYNKTKGIRVQQIYPILDWTDDEELEFIHERGIRLHPLYYRDDGTIDITRRLGCMCCPLASRKKRIAEFKAYPRMLRQYVRSVTAYVETHPNAKARFQGVYEMVYSEVMFSRYADFVALYKNSMFPYDEDDYKSFMEKEFNVNLEL